MRTLSRLLNTIFLSTLLLPLAAPQLSAQSNLTFTRIVNNWPTIELYFKAACEGEPLYLGDRSGIRVFEDSHEIHNFTLWCPNPISRYAVSLAFVLDASEELQGSARDTARYIAHTILSKMTDTTDEATVFHVSNTVKMVQPMTFSMDSVRLAVDSFTSSGKAAVWDGILAGLQEIVDHGTYPVNAVVVISPGKDNASVHTVEEVIAYANQNRIRVFAFAPASSVHPGLEMVTSLTGGRSYNAPTRNDLLAFFRDFTSTGIGFLECLITYPAECLDGSWRTVEIQLNDVCSGSDTASRTYHAPLDTSAVEWICIFVENTSADFGDNVKIPVRFAVPGSVTLPPGSFTISKGRQVVASSGLDFVGTALENAQVSITESDTAFVVQIHQPLALQDEGILFYFNVSMNAQGPETTETVFIGNWQATENVCLAAIMESGTITVGPSSIGTHTPALARAFDISPNPSSGAFDVALEFDAPTAFSIRIVNTLGQTVFQETVSERRTSYSDSIALDSPPGVYFFLLESGGRYDYKTIVVRYQ